MNGERSEEWARGIEIPYEPDSVLGPEINYGAGPPTAVYYQTEEDDWVRVTFEKLDALRVCRGEYLPYPDDWEARSAVPSLYIVENSRWLRERHAYEARHYRTCYEFGGDVDEMLTEFDHYLLPFHD